MSRTQPRLMPAGVDPNDARRSLARLEPAEARHAWRRAGRAARRLADAPLRAAGPRPGPGRGGSLLSILSVRSVLSFGSVASLLSVGSVLSLGSVLSILSIGSSGSILSIGSAGSILSIGSAGSLLSIGGAGSILAVGRGRGRRRGRAGEDQAGPSAGDHPGAPPPRG